MGGCCINERGESRMTRLVQSDRKAAVCETATCYNSAVLKNISEHTMNIEVKYIRRQQKTISFQVPKPRYHSRLWWPPAETYTTDVPWYDLPQTMCLNPNGI